MTIKQPNKKRTVLIVVSVVLLLSMLAGVVGIRCWSDRQAAPTVTEQNINEKVDIRVPPIAVPSQDEDATESAELSFDIEDYKPDLEPKVEGIRVEYITKEVDTNEP